jgi:hypothetical protein
MVKRGLAVVGFLMFAALAGVAQNSAQVQMAPVAVFDIPFSFHANDAVFPAGTYEVRQNSEGTDIELREVKSEKITLVSAYTSLSPRPLPNADLVFDVVDQEHYLSEYYLPGVNGLAFSGAPIKIKHMHEVIVQKK